MSGNLALGYSSQSQQARVVTEEWGRASLFCPNCDSPSLSERPANNPAIDFVCPRCSAAFQLKAKKGRIGATLADGAYATMLAAIREDRTPNLLIMRYERPAWRVIDLLLVPHFAFPESAIISRQPLSQTAQRAGWIGCNIDLNRIAPAARIPIVAAGLSSDPSEVRAQYERLKPLRQIRAVQRGWTLDVLNLVHRLGNAEFSNDDVYAFDRELEQLHPDNRHIRPKIRQQLQVLRDAGLLLHVKTGHWRVP
jgi:type II restriction enzyme